MLSFLGLAEGCPLEGHFCVVSFVIEVGQMTQGFILNYNMQGNICFPGTKGNSQEVENGDNPNHFGQPTA